MKKKIVVLMAALMVGSVVPVNAAQLKADGVLNTTAAKVDSTIDANANEYPSYRTINDLRDRRSVLKVNLKADGAGAVGETRFKLELTGGRFNEAHEDLYQYYNSNDRVLVGYDKAMDGASNLLDVYNNIKGSGVVEEVEGALKLDTAYEIASNFSELSSAIATVGANSSGELDSVNTLDDFLQVPVIKAEVDKLISKVMGTKEGVVELAHIPYKLDIESATSATVTIPNLQLSDKDNEIVVGGKEYKIKVSFYEGDPASSGEEVTNFSASGGKVSGITHIKFTEEAVASESKDTVLKDPYIAIPLGAVIVDGNEPVRVKVDAPYTSKVEGGEFTLTTNGTNNSGTSLVFSDSSIKVFEDSVTLSPIVVRENVRDSIGTSSNKDTASITLRVNGGFRFTGDSNNIKVYNDATGELIDGSKVKVERVNDATYNITVSGLGSNRSNPIGLRFEGLSVEATNDKNYGDVEISVSGDGIDSASKVVARRAGLGFSLSTVKEPTEIVAGRYYKNDSNLSESGNTTVDIKFAESVPNSLVTSRALDFTVPEGVKIVGINLKGDGIKNVRELGLDDFSITDNGRTLRLNRGDYGIIDKNKAMELLFSLDLSVEPGFSGDIKLDVTGGGISDSIGVVVGKAIEPFTISTAGTSINLGYQEYGTADIVISENKPGMFLEGNDLRLEIVAPYGTSELGFSSGVIECSGNELEVTNFGIKNGVISANVKRGTNKEAGVITLKDVKVGSTRSVPYGSYSLSIGGKALINNFSSDIDDSGNYNLGGTSKVGDSEVSNNRDNANLYMQDNISHYTYDNYVSLITDPGTFNHTVEVTVGDKTILFDGNAIDMDVSPYIQASSSSMMVPLRFVSLALGVDTGSLASPDASSKISWDGNTKTVTIYYGSGTNQKIIQFQNGSNIMVVDGTQIPMEYGVKAEIQENRMFVPFRALGQALGVVVDWDADTRTAIYNKGQAKVVNATSETTTNK